MATYVQWHCPDEDIWGYDELDDERWSTRHIEVHAQDQTFLAAASLAEVLEARDSGGADAVIAYEHRYGIVPDAPSVQLPPKTSRRSSRSQQRSSSSCGSKAAKPAKGSTTIPSNRPAATEPAVALKLTDTTAGSNGWR